jgi:class 3 adenylate cyclase/tetratricopeptide (TPR) repeat protein
MRCAKCGAENPASKRFCGDCGAELANRCARCGAENPPEKKFCGDCGSALGKDVGAEGGKPSAAEADGGVRIAPERQISETIQGERKTVTALFADIKDSTEMMRDLDPEEARAIVDPALRIMVEAVRRYDGYVVQSTGDGIFALFGAPAAYEDHPQRALYAALRIQEALREHTERLVAQGKRAPQARVGVNTGEVVMRTVETGGRVEYTPVGHVTNLAARMQGVAPAGGVVITEETRRLVEGYFKLRDLGPTEVKGIGEPINVYEVLGAGPLRGHFELAARRGLTKFVGREREVAEMKRALELARSGHGQIVAAVAEAGTGKSRLVYEFRAMLPGDCKVLEAYSVSYGKASAYLPVLELLYGYFGIEDADDKAARRAKIESRISALDPVLNDALPLLYTLLGLHEGPDPHAQMDPQIKRRRTLDAIKRIILRESLKQPTVVIFEDLHWINGETQALLDLLADGIANARVLLLVNYRPEYRHEWGNKSYYAQLRLDALGRESAGEMLSTLVGDGVELEPLKRMVIERTEGNPFFIEEMVQALFEQGILARGGKVQIAGSVSELRLPQTVQGILASRIDGLPAGHKELLQTLAVFGRESPLALIARVAAKSDAQLERMLAELRSAEFIFEQQAANDPVYFFKHALTQEVTYQSVLLEKRKLIHEHIGEALEDLYGSNLTQHITALAHHYSRSRNSRKAINYLTLAGEQAAARSAFYEATAQLNSAIRLLPSLPDEAERNQKGAGVLLTLGSVLAITDGWASPSRTRVLERARELCERTGESEEMFPVLWHMCQLYMTAGPMSEAQDFAHRSMRIAERSNNSTLKLLAEYNLGEVNARIGNFELAYKYLQWVNNSYKRAQHGLLAINYVFDLSVMASGWSGSIDLFCGRLDRALKTARSNVESARALGHPYSLVLALLHATAAYAVRGEAKCAVVCAAEALSLCNEQAFTDLVGYTRASLGDAHAAEGKTNEGIAEMLQALAELKATGWSYPCFVLEGLARAYLADGKPNQAVQAADEGLQMIACSGEFSYKPLLLIAKAQALLSLGQAEQVSSMLHAAIDIARKQGARLVEFGATFSLASLLASQGRREQSRAMLAEAYGWFTEGLDTMYLKAAKALLDQLNT